MKKIGIYVLLICLIGSFTILLFEYAHYSYANKKLIVLQKELNETYDKLRSISDDIAKLKLEEKIISNEKKNEIEHYQKWIRQNQVLKDLIK